MTELKAIKTQYDGKCASCGIEIRKGWDVFIDMNTSPKKLYCKNCAPKIQDGEVATAEAPTFFKVNAHFTGVCPRCGNEITAEETTVYSPSDQLMYCEKCGDILMSATGENKEQILLLNAIEIAINNISETVDLISGDLVAKSDMIADIHKMVDDLTKNVNQTFITFEMKVNKLLEQNGKQPKPIKTE